MEIEVVGATSCPIPPCRAWSKSDTPGMRLKNEPRSFMRPAFRSRSSSSFVYSSIVQAALNHAHTAACPVLGVKTYESFFDAAYRRRLRLCATQFDSVEPSVGLSHSCVTALARPASGRSKPLLRTLLPAALVHGLAPLITRISNVVVCGCDQGTHERSIDVEPELPAKLMAPECAPCARGTFGQGEQFAKFFRCAVPELSRGDVVHAIVRLPRVALDGRNSSFLCSTTE